MRKLLAAVLCAGIVSTSVEPAFSQVRAVAAESAGFSVGRAIPAGLRMVAPAGLSDFSSLSLLTPAPSLAAAPSWSAASVPAAAARASVPAAVRASVSAAPLAIGAQAVTEIPFVDPASDLRRSVVSLEALAHPAAPEAAQADRMGTLFFDQAGQQGSSAFAADVAPRESLSRPEAHGARTKLLAFGRKWGLPLTVASLVALGPLASGAGAAGIDPHGASFAFWSDVARGVAMAVPLLAIGGWGLFKRYRAKEADAARARAQVTPLHKPIQPELKHFLGNMALGAIGIAAIAVIAGPYINTFNAFIDAHSIGILHWLKIKGWANVAASMVILDFLDWSMHYASHRFSWLWRLHKVHHTDLDYDLSTTYRMHPLETAVIMLFGFLEFALVGPNLLAMTIGDLIAIVMGQYQHANITMPEPIENFLSKIFMTSHKHYIHHSMSPDEYDSNYGHIFSFWDRLLGTFRDFAPDYLTGKVSPGIREYPNPQELTVIKLLLMPFQKQQAGPKKTAAEPKPLAP